MIKFFDKTEVDNLNKDKRTIKIENLEYKIESYHNILDFWKVNSVYMVLVKMKGTDGDITKMLCFDTIKNKVYTSMESSSLKDGYFFEVNNSLFYRHSVLYHGATTSYLQNNVEKYRFVNSTYDTFLQAAKVEIKNDLTDIVESSKKKFVRCLCSKIHIFFDEGIMMDGGIAVIDTVNDIVSFSWIYGSRTDQRLINFTMKMFTGENFYRNYINRFIFNSFGM